MSNVLRPWELTVERIEQRLANNDWRDFLTWPDIRQTMFVTRGDYIKVELEYLQSRVDWETRWKPAVREVSTGQPLPCEWYPESSCNLLHHAYHVAQFEDLTGICLAELPYIVEFGGGYGSMYRLLRRLGFTGEYSIFDIPCFTRLQNYYLSELGLTKDLQLISSLEQFFHKLQALADRTYAFLAHWSLSESPLAVRDQVRARLLTSKAMFVGYQADFYGIDNILYFRNWQDAFPEVCWRQRPIVHLKGHYYLTGVR